MSLYLVQAWDLNDNSLITDLSPNGGITFSERLNEAGEFNFDLSLTDPKVKEAHRLILALAGNPFKVLITTNDHQTILYSGIAWTAPRKKGQGALKINGKALPSYFNQVTSAVSYRSPVSPTTLLASVVSDVQTRPGANIWVGTRLQASSTPPNITPNYSATQYTFASQIIGDLTAAADPGSGGVDYYMEHSWDGETPVHTMVICAPRAGRDRNSSDRVVNLDAALDWDWPQDTAGSGNRIIAVGSGSGSSQPTAVALSAYPVGGKGQPPLLEKVLSYSGVSSKAQLQAIANGAIQMYGRPITTPTVEFPVDNKIIPLGSFIVGDDVLVTASPGDDFPRGLNEWWRIVAYSVTIPDDGIATMKLTLNRPPVI
ncbi:minor tail protein [Arthrobacter phage Sonali]|uniref:Minor tail protein n=1 Tax=Arthrobacter phage Sonali TaxID=2510495 RepID=A0A411CQS2_9CAUD|nr:minor tail protein [Arthrobacter phage Sonali]QAY16130.1 minor tail protein [Arthrobacter phage Sonali]